LRTGTHNIVFLDRGDGYITPKEIELGPRAGDDFIVLSGLSAGESIINSANFLIDSESQLQAALGSFAPPPPGAGGVGASTPQGTIQMTSDPSPPHKGSNTLHLRVRDSSGRPVEGAQVKVVFYMAAMPAMGMAAMRSEGIATDKGGGNYDAAITLDSGGTWQVTIVATKAGAQIATQQLNMTAQGPMG
jgi:YtkA-like